MAIWQLHSIIKLDVFTFLRFFICRFVLDDVMAMAHIAMTSTNCRVVQFYRSSELCWWNAASVLCSCNTILAIYTVVQNTDTWHSQTFTKTALKSMIFGSNSMYLILNKIAKLNKTAFIEGHQRESFPYQPSHQSWIGPDLLFQQLHQVNNSLRVLKMHISCYKVLSFSLDTSPK